MTWQALIDDEWTSIDELTFEGYVGRYNHASNIRNLMPVFDTAHLSDEGGVPEATGKVNLRLVLEEEGPATAHLESAGPFYAYETRTWQALPLLLSSRDALTWEMALSCLVEESGQHELRLVVQL